MFRHSEAPGVASPLPSIDLSHYSLEPICEDGAFVMCRGRRSASSQPPTSVLVLMPTAKHPRLECVRMLEHEYALRADLDRTWAVRPLALVRYQSRTCLVLEDPGGELLARRLERQPLELGALLRLGVGLAVAVGALHRRGIIHKDITPRHLVIDETTSQVWLTGLRAASRLGRERQTPEPLEVIAGTLPYMAPEQTGRMNRSIDSRSDLYALGVTLYEMLTGTLPFTAADPMEWVHCHIARQPVPPAERVGGVPPAVSAIVMRLLAKTAEQRYQTAAGLEHDLRQCLRQWEAAHRIDEFALGEHDTPDRLVITERLYGRDREIEMLLAAFDRVVTSGTPELVLVSGQPGIGKSSVVNELQKALVPRGGWFASAKFDQSKRGIPYASLAHALQSLVGLLLGKSEAELAVWRAALGEALGSNGGLMVDLVPDLKLIIGDQPPAPEVPPQEAQRRFHVVFERFIRVFAQPEHPLALFVDDLQWLDTATLDLLQHLLTQAAVRNVLFIGAYRGNEVDAADPLVRAVDAVRDAGAAVHEITLAPLAPGDLAQLIADALRTDLQRVAPLAQLVGDKTAGNPFFITQFLTALSDEGLLTFEHAPARWSWDIAGIRARRYTDNVADLMLDRLARLPPATLTALRSLACLGNSAEVTTLALVLEKSVEQVHADLWDAGRVDLVIQQRGAYRFLHDRVQEAAYALVPEAQRASEHLRIGRLLVAHTPLEKREATIFEIVNQLNRGVTLMTSQEERDAASELNLIAGRRAKASAAHAAALQYFVSGAALLPDDRWESRSALTVALQLGRAECEFVTGALAAAEDGLSTLAARVTNLVDEGSVTSLRIALYGALRRFDRAVEIGLAYLTRLGIEWSPHPTDEAVREEHERLWRQLGTRRIESLYDLPGISDPRIRLTMDLLREFHGPTHWTDQNLEHLVLLRMTNLSAQYGNSDGSTSAYASLNVVVGARFGRYAAGYRFGLLALDLVDKKGLDGTKPKVYRLVGALVVPWIKHLREARPLLRQALEATQSWRPLPLYMMWMHASVVAHGLASGDPLTDVQREAEEGRRRVAKGLGKAVVFDLMSGQLGLIRTLRGLTAVFGSFGTEELAEHRLEEYLQSGPQSGLTAGWYCIFKLQALVYSAEHDRAAALTERAQRVQWTISAEFLEAEYHFYGALARSGAADAAMPPERRELLAAVAGNHQRLLQWAANCPENFESRAALVGAELARQHGRELDAEHLYEEAIRSARLNEFVHIEGLANELAGRFYAARGFDTSANAYLKEARQCYLRWGADGKVRQLDQRYPHLVPQARVTDARSPISEPIERLELATVLEALQAVSGEIVLERLVDTLLRMALEQAGAERAVLLLAEAGELRIRAEASISGSVIAVRRGDTQVAADVLPESVVQYVVHTKETLILNDASASNLFATDAYIRRTQARSVACLPLVKQAQLIAVLFLENHLSPDVFTPERMDVLRVVAPQAAMALENSRLYRELELREAKVRRLVEANMVGVVISRVDGAIVEANDAALQIVGYTRQDVQSGRVGWRALTPREWQAPSDHAVAQLRARGSFDVFEMELMRNDGTRVPVLLAGAAVDEARQESIVFVIDLTERKRAEEDRERLRQLLGDLAHVNRISMMGELAASLAHELKQPITAAITDAKTSLRWLSRDQPDLARARKAMARVLRSGARAAAIIDHLRSFYKKEARPERTLVDLNALAGEMLVLLRSEARAYGVSLHADLAAHQPMVAADRVQLQQVLMNLMLNGIEAMKDTGGDLIVRSSTAQDGQLTISVSDTGAGLPVGHSDEIFAAFFSTKPHGSGMGLTISRSIVEAHGGRLWAAENAGRGATFHFTLPATAVKDRVAGAVEG